MSLDGAESYAYDEGIDMNDGGFMRDASQYEGWMSFNEEAYFDV